MIRRSALALAAITTAALLFAPHQSAQGQAPNRPAFVPTVRVDKNVKVPMRDGVSLATDIYYPDGPGPFPVLLSRTPYNKNGGARNGEFFAKNGYVVVIQDSRGLYASDGEWHPYIDEGRIFNVRRDVDLIDCSFGGNDARQRISVFPGYQVPFAAVIKSKAGLLTGAGLIHTLIERNQSWPMAGRPRHSR